MAFLEVRLFGSLHILHNGQAVTLAYDKVRTLLAYLLIESGRPHRRETLAGLLWPEQTEKEARHSLSQALLKLRQAIDPDRRLVLADRHTVRLKIEGNVELDTARFTAKLHQCVTHHHRHPELCEDCKNRWEAAASLYTGPFLAGLSLADAPQFEQWLTQHRQRFHRQVMNVLAQLTHFYIQQGELSRAIHYAQRQLELEPWLEKAHRQLMVLLARAGQRSRALKQYEQCRVVLQQEFDTDVSAETKIMEQQIRLRSNFSLHNLPRALTPFVGREVEIDNIAQLLTDAAASAITLTGMGGIGKTRLALTIAEQFLHPQTMQPVAPFADGIYFIDLVPLRSAEQVEAAVAEALTISLGPGDGRQQLCSYLRDKQMLLIFDNFEHITAAATLVTDLRKTAPSVAIIATSRTRLRVRGEKVVPLYGLPVTSDPIDSTGSNKAVELFITIARQQAPDLSFTPADQEQVSRICQIVEGVPLAIELAVQWVSTLPLAVIANELEAGMDALSTEILDLPIRHRSMQAVFNGSWRRLTHEAQAVLEKISVFQSGFTLEAAAAVAGAPYDTLAHLVNQSLLRFNPQEKRYHCHELLRQYAAAKFDANRDQTRQTRQKHLDYYGQLAARGGEALRGGDTVEWMARLKLEQGNFEIAFEWGYVNDLEQAARLAIDLHLFYFITGRMITGQQLYEKLLNKKAELSAPIEGWVLTWYTAMIWVQGRLEESQTLAEEAEKIFQNVNDEAGIIMSHHHRMVAAHYRGDLETAALHSDRAVAMARRIKKSAPWFLMVCLQGRATMLANLGQEEAAYRTSSECLQLSQETGNKMTATYAMANLARFAIRRGDFAQAHALSEQALEIAQDLNDRRMEGIQYLVLGNIDLAQRDFESAVEHLEIALAIADQINNADLLDEITMLLGDAYRGTGQYPLALHAFQRWGEISRQMNHQANMATSLEKIAITYWNLFPDNKKSLRWFAAAAAWQKNATGGGQESINNRFLEMFRDEISPPEFARIWEGGQSLSLTEELAEAISVEAPAKNAP